MKYRIIAAIGLLVVEPACAQPTNVTGTRAGFSHKLLAVKSQTLTFPEPAFEEEYRFPIALEISGITHHRNGKKQETEVRYYFNPQKSWMAAAITEAGPMMNSRSTDALSIFDFDNHSILLLTPSQKTGLVMDLNPVQILHNPQAPAKNQEEAWKCYKTGKKKIILTLHCEECMCIDDLRKASATMWITRELPVNLAPTPLRSPFTPQFRVAQKAGGVLVSGNFYENGTLKTSINMQSVDRAAGLVFSLSDYRIR